MDVTVCVNRVGICDGVFVIGSLMITVRIEEWLLMRRRVRVEYVLIAHKLARRLAIVGETFM